MGAEKALHRNDFWKILQDELPKHGYHKFTAEQNGQNYVCLIDGVTSEGKPTQQRFPFPRFGKSFESTLNFRSKLRKFIRQELPQRNCYASLSTDRIRKPGMYVQKINHDAPKKELAIPNTLKQAVQTGGLDVIAAPFIPEEKPTVVVETKPKNNEPVSDNMVLAVFLVPVSELSTVIAVTDGVAKFRGSKPAPLRIVEQMVPQQVIQQQPTVTVEPPVQPEVIVHKPTQIAIATRAKKGSGQSLKDKFLARMKTNRSKKWSSEDFADLAEKNSRGPTLAAMYADKLVERPERGLYKLAKTH